MKTNSICKFPPYEPSNTLSVSSFVFETNTEIMQKKELLTRDRMILVEQGAGEFLFDDVPHSF